MTEQPPLANSIIKTATAIDGLTSEIEAWANAALCAFLTGAEKRAFSAIENINAAVEDIDKLTGTIIK